MIEIKQEGWMPIVIDKDGDEHGIYIGIRQRLTDGSLPQYHDVYLSIPDLPHLISRLIELGGVAVKWPDIRSEWHPVECPSIFKHLLENYHLIPKADKK